MKCHVIRVDFHYVNCVNNQKKKLRYKPFSSPLMFSVNMFFFLVNVVSDQIQ